MEKAPPVVIEVMEMAETPKKTMLLVCSANNIESAAFLRVSQLLPARAALLSPVACSMISRADVQLTATCAKCATRASACNAVRWKVSPQASTCSRWRHARIDRLALRSPLLAPAVGVSLVAVALLAYHAETGASRAHNVPQWA